MLDLMSPGNKICFCFIIWKVNFPGKLEKFRLLDLYSHFLSKRNSVT